MMSLLFVFCQLVAMQVLGWKACAVVLQWAQLTRLCQNWNTTPAWMTFFAVPAICRRQRIWSRWWFSVSQMWLCGWFCFVLAESMVMWRWQNVLQNEFLNWSLKMLQVMWCDQMYMLLLATGISVRMLNGRERKEVWRNSQVTPASKLMRCIHLWWRIKTTLRLLKFLQNWRDCEGWCMRQGMFEIINLCCMM